MGTVVKLDGRTRLMLPASVRRELHLKPGDSVWVEQTPSGFQITPLALKVSGAKGLFKAHKEPEEHVVDDFIRTRGNEQHRED